MGLRDATLPLPSLAFCGAGFSFQQRQCSVYPLALSKCQVLSPLLLIYSPRCSRGGGLDIHLLGSVYALRGRAAGSSFPAWIQCGFQEFTQAQGPVSGVGQNTGVSQVS